jgi:hypothetical protein
MPSSLMSKCSSVHEEEIVYTIARRSSCEEVHALKEGPNKVPNEVPRGA